MRRCDQNYGRRHDDSWEGVHHTKSRGEVSPGLLCAQVQGLQLCDGVGLYWQRWLKGLSSGVELRDLG
jgi:hypothetical protein